MYTANSSFNLTLLSSYSKESQQVKYQSFYENVLLCSPHLFSCLILTLRKHFMFF